MSRLYHAGKQQSTVTQLFLFSPIETPVKTCTRCKDTKPITDFPKCSHTRDGYTNPCKACRRVQEQEKVNQARIEQNNPKNNTRKTCVKCGEEKPINAFSPLRTECKACRVKYAAQNTERRKDTPEYQAWLRKYYDSPEYKQYNRANARRWRKTERGRELGNAASRRNNKKEKRKEFERMRRLSPEYKDYHRDYSKRYTKEYPEKVNEVRMRRIARQKEAEVGKVDYKAILEEHGYICHICGQAIDPAIKKGPGSLNFDHVKPLAGEGERKGTHSQDNILPAHRVCNNRKCTRLMSELTEWDRRGPNVA